MRAHLEQVYESLNGHVYAEPRPTIDTASHVTLCFLRKVGSNQFQTIKLSGDIYKDLHSIHFDSWEKGKIAGGNIWIFVFIL